MQTKVGPSVRKHPLGKISDCTHGPRGPLLDVLGLLERDARLDAGRR